MASQQVETFSASQISASTNVTAGAGSPDSITKFYLGGIFVSAASNTPTLTIYDDNSTGTGTKVVDTFTPVAATFYRLPFICKKGVYVVISGTVSCTVGWQPA